MTKSIEMDRTVLFEDQLKTEGGPVVLINTFVLAPEDAEKLIAAWAPDAAIMKIQPGFISAQLHRGISGSGVFVNYAVWESVALYRAALGSPELQAHLVKLPESTTLSPHLFQTVAVPGVCIR